MKRGQTDLSFICAVNKPKGPTSHDVINDVRRITGERRIGHAGTLDPAASGVLVVLVGPAARLNPYLECQRKRYRARIMFGACTDTDDAEGSVIRKSAVPTQVGDITFAHVVLESFLGPQMQLPPVYSAIKRSGEKAYEAARAGKVVNLEPRQICVHQAILESIDEVDDAFVWDVAFDVSKGTYIRALARDIGRAAGTEAHLCALERTASGNVTLDECVSLRALEQEGLGAALDPVRVCGMRFAFLDDAQSRAVQNGNPLVADDILLHEYLAPHFNDACACFQGIEESKDAPVVDEPVMMICGNTVRAVYAYHPDTSQYRAKCIFTKGISRGLV